MPSVPKDSTSDTADEERAEVPAPARAFTSELTVTAPSPSAPRVSTPTQDVVRTTGLEDFSQRRHRLIEQAENEASVRRLRFAVSYGIPIWMSFAIMDMWLAAATNFDGLRHLLILRFLGLPLGIPVLIWLSGNRTRSTKLIKAADLTVFTWVALLVSLICLSFRDITSPHAPGLAVVLIARGATMYNRWQEGIWLFGIPMLTFPAVMGIASFFDPTVAASFADTERFALFGLNLALLTMTTLMLTAGGHFVWALRRETLEVRSIDRYALEYRLGSGGMGDVWAARDRALKNQVALKMLRYEGQDSSNAVKRFEREVRALAELNHPHTVRVFDYGVTLDGLWYYTMELLHGLTLREFTRDYGPIEPRRLAQLMGPVLRALGEAHAKGIVHRDIKPDNIFLLKQGDHYDFAKLLDFGIARASSEEDAQLTQTGWLAGTPAFLAPELARGRPADARSDIYSFGVTLYFALSGELPFADEDRAVLLEAHRSREAASLRMIRPEVPAALDAFVLRCLAKTPAARFKSAEQAAQALEVAATTVD